MNLRTAFTLTVISILLLIVSPAIGLAADDALSDESFGWLSLLPPVVAIALALILRQVLPSLLIGVLLGATIYLGWNPVLGLMRMLDTYMLNALANRDHAAIIMFSMTLGGMVGVISRCGGSAGIVAKISKYARTPKSGAIATWAMGMLIFFDDYANTLIVGNTMRPYTDRLKISREKLSYIVDSTAAPIACIAFISTWIGFEMGLIGDSFSKLGIERNVYLTFLQSIPYMFYCVLALFVVPMIALMGRDFGPMLKAERRARTTGKLFRDGAQPLQEDITSAQMGLTSSHWNALGPILLVIIVTALGLYWNGREAEGAGAPLYQIIGAANSFSVLMWAAFCGALTAVIMAIANSPLKFNETMEAFVSGVKAMMLAMIILILAWALGKICDDLGTAVYVSAIVKGAIAPWMLPGLTFVIAAFISFSTGTSWGTMAILVPIIIPVTFNLIVPEGVAMPEAGSFVESQWHIMIASIGSVLAGSIFGDHCSPISDTTIMSSMTSGADHIDHVRTQMPYALVIGAVGILLGNIPAGLGWNPWLSLIAGMGILWVVFRVAGGRVEN